jgi:hypothetical protein
MPSNVYPAPFPPPPQVVNFGGSVLAAPVFVPVFFAGDDPNYVMKLSDFTAKVGATKYWAAAVGEYGVGPATSAAPVILSEMAPATIDDTGIQAWLANELAPSDGGPDGGSTLPQPDANTVYVIFYPASTTITLQNQQSCTSFGGYHSDAIVQTAQGMTDVPYAVIPRCTNFPPLTGVDAITGTTSHEMAEAATDPLPMSMTPAYAQVDDAHLYWMRLLGGGEVGDMCAQFPGAFTTFSELPYAVQRIWSNAAAKAGHDPCQPPLPGEVYFNSPPNLPDMITVMTFGGMFTERGVHIPVGQSKTIQLDLYSDAATSGPWTVSVKDAASTLGMSTTPLLDLKLDKTSGVNGEKLNLTITVKTAGKHNTESFIIESRLGNQVNLWFGLVGSM